MTAVELSPMEACALNDLGHQLASKTRFWKAADGEVGSRSVVRCTFDGVRWMLIVHGAIGVIQAGDLQVRVQPKISLDHVIYFLSVCGQIPRFVRSDTSVSASLDLLALVAHWFMFAVDGVLKRDLIRDYADTTDDLAAARGQLDPLATGSQYYAGRFVLNCRFDEFDLDTPLNRVLKAGVRRIAGDQHFNESLRRSASRILQRLDHVGELLSGDLAAPSDRRTAHYDDALMLARLLIERKSRTMASGGCSAWSFLIPTSGAVESAIRALLAERLAPMCIVTNRGKALRPTALTVNPDLVFEPSLAVADVKYKTNWEGLPRGDLYQVVSFATAYHVKRAALVSFKTTACGLLCDTPFDETVVRHLCWDATHGVSPGVAADRFANAVKQWLDIDASVADKSEKSMEVA
jgi:5-methylcytosine-specific restriction enzyme subunit McrC